MERPIPTGIAIAPCSTTPSATRGPSREAVLDTSIVLASDVGPLEEDLAISAATLDIAVA
jgi:hypothetical protein